MSTSHQAQETDLLRGTELSARLTVSLFSWFAYEYFINFAAEVEFFWAKREWTRGRVLFFINLYTTWLTLIPSLYVALVPETNIEICTRNIYTALVFNLLGICVGQMFVANKTWNLFQGWRNIRVSLAIGLALSISLSFVLLGIYIGDFKISTVTDAPLVLVSAGCKAQPPANFWAIFIPPLLFHTYLHGLAIYLAVLNKNLWDLSATTRKVFWDAGTINLVASVTLLWTIILISRADTLSLSIPAAISPIALIATSITLTRVSITTRMFLAHEESYNSQDPLGSVIEGPLTFNSEGGSENGNM